jgi:glycosyltransferase involved in cell wall biosynthesis
MKILFLFPYPIDEAPSQRFRFEQYLKYLPAYNILYDYQSFWDISTWRILYKKGHQLSKLTGLIRGFLRRIKILFKLRRYDLVFVHRECTPVGPPVIEWFIAKIFQKKIIFDFDDAIWLPDSPKENKLMSVIKWHSKTISICRWSYKVSCGNSYLADFAREHTSTVIINPTVVDTASTHNPSLHKIFKREEIISVGWTGTHSTQKYLELLIPVMRKLEAKYNHLRFIIIANRKPDLPLARWEFIPWSKENEVKDLLQLDIGIMPLTDDLWAKGKCGFKAIQYMALEIPCVASPVGVNTEIITHDENGFLCESQDEWLQYLSMLIELPALRTRLGVNGRKKIVQHYSTSSNLSSFVSSVQ